MGAFGFSSVSEIGGRMMVRRPSHQAPATWGSFGFSSVSEIGGRMMVRRPATWGHSASALYLK